jgi:hypothetical protein
MGASIVSKPRCENFGRGSRLPQTPTHQSLTKFLLGAASGRQIGSVLDQRSGYRSFSPYAPIEVVMSIGPTLGAGGAAAIAAARSDTRCVAARDESAAGCCGSDGSAARAAGAGSWGCCGSVSRGRCSSDEVAAAPAVVVAGRRAAVAAVDVCSQLGGCAAAGRSAPAAASAAPSRHGAGVDAWRARRAAASSAAGETASGSADQRGVREDDMPLPPPPPLPLRAVVNPSRSCSRCACCSAASAAASCSSCMYLV